MIKTTNAQIKSYDLTITRNLSVSIILNSKMVYNKISNVFIDS